MPRDTPTSAIEEATVETYPTLTSPWQRLFEAALRARVAKRAPDRVGATLARSLTGCLLRVLVVAVVLFLVVVGALFFFGRTLLQGGQSY